MPDIRHLIHIAAPAEAIFELVSTPDGFARWWAEDVELGPGGLVRLGFFDRQTVYALRAETMLRPIRAGWRCESGQQWSGTHLVFMLERKGAETLMHFSHTSWREDSEYFTLCNTTWGELMYRLKATAEGKSPGPLFLKGSLA